MTSSNTPEGVGLTVPEVLNAAAEPLRLCGYCKAWQVRPCGPGCVFDGRGPTWEQHVTALRQAATQSTGATS